MQGSNADSACTVYIQCGRRTSLAMRVCADIGCTEADYYYQTSDGARLNCGTQAVNGSFTFQSSFCNSAASRVVNYCQAR